MTAGASASGRRPGDAGRPELAQDAGSRNGKLLRLDPDEYRGDGGTPETFPAGIATHRASRGSRAAGG